MEMLFFKGVGTRLQLASKVVKTQVQAVVRLFKGVMLEKLRSGEP